jgi:cob(I)alamin adenosyltransferase
MDKGLLHIYTGDGKGKTTAAIGISVRAKSSGLKALFVQFFKEKDSGSEIALLNDIGIKTIIFEKVKSPYFNPDIDKVTLRAEVRASLSRLKEIFAANAFDLIVLDEFICLIAEDVLTEDEALEFIRQKPEKLELVLTGKGAPESLIRLADYVTYMQRIKHPFDENMEARKGIEF